jgi:hypothetical protein
VPAEVEQKVALELARRKERSRSHRMLFDRLLELRASAREAEGGGVITGRSGCPRRGGQTLCLDDRRPV